MYSNIAVTCEKSVISASVKKTIQSKVSESEAWLEVMHVFGHSGYSTLKFINIGSHLFYFIYFIIHETNSQKSLHNGHKNGTTCVVGS